MVEKLGEANYGMETLAVAADDGNLAGFLLGDVPSEVRKKWLNLFLPVR